MGSDALCDYVWVLQHVLKILFSQMFLTSGACTGLLSNSIHHTGAQTVSLVLANQPGDLYFQSCPPAFSEVLLSTVVQG